METMETKRLLIRHFTENNTAACFQNWGQDKELGKYIILYPMKEIQQMKSLVKCFLSNENAWIVIDKGLL